MKRILSLLFCISLGANAWLWWRRVETRAATATRDSSPTLPANPAPTLRISAIESADPTTLGEALRASGANGSELRAMFEGLLRRRHREKLAAVRIERAHNAWWRAGRTVQDGDARLVQEMVTEPLERALGRDPLNVADAESRYSFLSEGARRRLAQIDLDYADLQRPPGVTATTAQLRSEAAEQKLVAEERRKDVLAALTPEERAEYDLRFSGTAGMIGNRAKTMGATEAEYRALKPLLDDFDAKSKALPRGENFSSAYEDLQRATTGQLVDAVGYERALEYVWSGYANFYGPMRRAAETGLIPADTPGRVMDLTVETGQRAGDVHADATLTPDQKRAALLALQQTARTQLNALLPVEVQRNLPPEATRWLNDLGAGRYAVMQPSLLSSGGYVGATITSPTPPKRMYLPSMPVRPTAK